ncbi:hypothetical protein K502DRAFT_369105 [Neoconidiobolus thromboides FSU 785]|nr:hypothetical protein K502DRAFT_369105 [Neoconidiobolus thromboides FSU 785]
MEDQIIKDTRRQVWSTNKQGNITKGEKKSIKGKVDFKKGFKENKPVKKSVFDRLGLITETNNNTNINFKKNVFQTGRDKGQAFLNKHKLNQARYENVEENDLTGIIDGVSADEDLDGMGPDDFGSNDMESDGNGIEDTEIDDMRSDDVDNDGNGVAEYDSENILEGIEEALYDSDEEDGYGYKKNSRNDIKPIKEFAAGESVLSNAMKARRKTVEERIYEEKLRQENMKELDKLKEERLLKMKHYIKKGFMADPEKKMDINEAISLTPDCYKMCPEFEKAERKFENSVDKFEKEPYELVKKYTRSAAGVHIIMPCDVRTPETLLETTRYLIDKIVNNDKYTFYETHSFVRDRLRAIGKDFIVQHHNGPIAVEVYEMISRFYILSIHELSKVNKWDEIPEERNQLKAALSNLVEQYEMLRKKGIVCTNEHEFQSYIELNNLFIIKSAYNFKQTNSTFKYDSNRKETKLVNKIL